MIESPWLNIPLDDYEGHMALPEVGQAAMLADVLADAIERYSPSSIAVLGCAGGNGLERIPATVNRVVAVDINPRFLYTVSARFGNQFQALQIVEADLAKGCPPFQPVDLLYTGLLLEYVDPAPLIASLSKQITTGGHWVALTENASTHHPVVSPSTYTRLQVLASCFQPCDAETIARLGDASGFQRIHQRELVSSGGKTFSVQHFAVKTDHSGQLS